jgi:DNA repair ATPase RecN
MFTSALLVAFLASTPALPPVEEIPSGGDIPAELRLMNESLGRLVEEDSNEVETSRVDLLLQRVRLAMRELAPATAELRSLRERLDREQERLLKLRPELERIEKLGPDYWPAEGVGSTFEQYLRQLRGIVENRQKRVRRVADRLGVVEAEVATKTAEIEELKTAVDRVLFVQRP